MIDQTKLREVQLRLSLAIRAQKDAVKEREALEYQLLVATQRAKDAADEVSKAKLALFNLQNGKHTI